LSEVTPTRASGGPPYLRPGSVVTWHYRSPGWRPGDAEWVAPLTVVRDDADGLVAWLPVGTPHLVAVREDGGDLRSGDPRTAFTAPRVQARRVWHTWDVLRIAPTGRPWSVWLWFEPGSGRFDGYYVNLETPHVRDGAAVYSSDHVLDVEVEVDRTHSRKDVDELAAAVEQGRYTAEEAARITATAAEVEAVVDAWGPPFCDGWETFRPDPAWPLPGLP
jgi:Protein of unknown function (DUF402)